MRNAHRPMGRFFCLCIAVAAAILPLVIDAAAQVSSPSLTRVVDTVYRADGVAAKGTVLISWPAFTTADGKAVAAGSLSVPLGNGGAFAASLAPNTGAQPAGVYYKVVYQLAGQEPSTEYWVVPATGSTSIGSVRAKLMPPTIAAQVLTRDVADTNYVHVTGDQTMNGVVTFTTPPAVPAPKNPGDAANKGYVDAANANLMAAPAPIGNVTPNSGTFTSLSAQTLNSTVYVQCPNCSDWGAAINAAINSCANGYGGYKACKVVLPFMNGPQTTAVVISSPTVSVVGQGRTTSVLNCAVTNGDCILIYPQPFTVQPGSEIGNFSVIGNGAAGQNLIHARDVIGFTFHDLFLDGASASGGACFWLEAYRNWSERNAFRDINTGYNCKKTWRLSADGGNTYCQTTGNYCSLGYNQWDNIQGNPTNVETFWSQEGASLVYGGQLRTVINKSGVGSTVFHWQDTAQFLDMDTHIKGEENGSGGYLYECGPNNQVNLGADTNFGATLGATLPNHLQAGCTFAVVATGNGNIGSDVIQTNRNLGAGGTNPNAGAIGTWLMPIYYELSQYTPSGVGFNARYVPAALGGGGWTLFPDGTFNGGGFITNNRNNQMQFYVFPNTGNSIQTIAQTNLTNYLRSVIDNTGNQMYFNNSDVEWGSSWWRTDVTRRWAQHMMPSNDAVSPYRMVFYSYDGSVYRNYWDARFDGSFNFLSDPNLNGHALKQGTNVVVDAGGNATVQNLTVNGTCTGCGSGGGSGNLASPPAIGSNTPNAGTFTTLASQVVNGVANAARFAGADPCAKINAAIGWLDATAGGTVEARGFTAADLATSCTTTLTIDRPVRLVLPEGVLLLGGNPGILINTYSSGVKIEGRGWHPNYNTPGSKGTILRSVGPYPMIMDTAGSQGTDIREVELDGNNTGTFGFLGAYSGGITLRHIHVHNFQYTGVMALGGINSYYDLWSNNNGGEGMVIASDVVLEGNMQVALNGGSGVHMISAGAHFKGSDVDHNGLHGIYLDGRHRPDWTAATRIIQPMVIMPLTGNAGGYLYYSANVGGTTGTTAPAWNQTPNAVFTDGSVVWVNIGNNVAARTMDAIAQIVWIEGGYVDDNGTATPSYPGFVADNIRAEGDPTVNAQNSCNWIHITGAWVSQAAVRNATITGIHFLNCYESEVSGAVLVGSGYAGDTAPLTPDQGGLVVENSGMNTFSNITAHFQTRSAVRLIGARENLFSNVSLTYGAGNSSVPSPLNYAINIDANSSSNQFNMVNIDTGGNANSKGIYNRGSLTYVDNYQTMPGLLPALDDLQYAVLTNAHGRNANIPVEFDVSGTSALAIDSGGKVIVGGDLSVRDIPGHEYFVSKYASIQAAIDAAYNNGTVQGGAMVIDDRTAPYSGPGFIVRDSVTLKLAATTYTITGTVTNNNGVSNVTAGIISMPGSHIVGAGTSANHGTNVNAGAGLNADLIATSTVGTGAGANAQWWHWGSIENFHIDGKKPQQTAGSCINVENMGETAVLRALEVGNCYTDDIRLEGNFATQSEISNVTVNSAGQFGVNLDNFQGVGVLRGLSGDSNATSIIRFNGSQSATLTVLGLKSEEEISGHDPLITIDMPADGSQPAFYLVGGYTYARAGVKDVIEIINGKSGAAPFVTVNNFYVDANFVNAVNDTVNSRTFAASNMNKVPFSYLPTGSYQSGQAFTFAPGTFIQGGSSALTEIFGSSTDGSSMIAAQGNGDGTSYFTGGLKIGIPNRTQFGQPPEMMARMGSRFLGAGNGYDTNTWVFVPIWKSGDSSNRWIGEPNQRWPEMYATDLNATTATIGTLHVTSCTGCGPTQVNADWNASSGAAQILNKPVLATVATSGSYNDLANKPTIPAAQVNADWNASSGVAQVLNKPAIPAASASTPAMNGAGAVGTSSNYARADHVHPSDTSRVATSTTVNGHALGGNITVTASDVGAMHMVSGTLVGPSSGIAGNSGDQNMFSVTIPANTVAVGSGIRCYARWAKTSGSNAVTYKWTLGSTTFGTQAVGASTSQNWVTDVEIFTPASMSNEVMTANPIIAGTAVLSGPQVGLTASETMSNALTLKMTFNATSSETVTPKTFYCTTVQ